MTRRREPAAHRHRPAAGCDPRGPARGHRGRLRRRSPHPRSPSGGSSSRYGAQMGSRNVIRSLATLAMTDARRAALVDAGADRRPAHAAGRCGTRPRSSWAPGPAPWGTRSSSPRPTMRARWTSTRTAGATSGRSVADALASAANYLQGLRLGRRRRWGQEVALPPGFDFAWSAPGRTQTLRGVAGHRRQGGLRAVTIRPRAAAAARSSGGCARAGVPGLGQFSRAAQIQPVDGLRAARRPSRRPHRRRHGAGGILARGRQAADPGRARRSCRACWRPGGSIPAGSTASSATARVMPSVPPSATSTWPRTAIPVPSAGAVADRRRRQTAPPERPCC